MSHCLCKRHRNAKSKDRKKKNLSKKKKKLTARIIKHKPFRKIHLTPLSRPRFYIINTRVVSEYYCMKILWQKSLLKVPLFKVRTCP